MKTYNLKSVARRGSMLTAAFVIAGASLLPFTSASAEALNPLTDRSLTLSSSAPGWDYLDGSNNTTYAAPNSGANGQKTGNTFAFKVSSNNVQVNAMTFQYCTAAAGDCNAPGNNSGTAPTRGADTTTTSDLNVVVDGTASVHEVNNTTDPVFSTTNGVATAIPNRDGSEGHFIVMTKSSSGGNWTQSTGWTMTATTNEDGTALTGTDNFITLSNTSGFTVPENSQVKVIFFATDDSYITNPGAGAFFVKINTFSDASATTLVDGGVTVANVMNLGISIQTKVLETMDFSVGTVDPYTLEVLADDNGSSANGADENSQLALATNKARLVHGTCDPILNAMLPTDQKNTLELGSETNENSLSTDITYSTHSYFRLSSNASAGATVYYSGVTLSNTVDDQITPIGATKAAPIKGTEQFGLALANNVSGTPTADGDAQLIDYKTEREQGHVYENGADNEAAGLAALNDWLSGTSTGSGNGTDPGWTPTGAQKLPQLRVFTGSPNNVSLDAEANYNEGAGVVNPVSGIYTGTTARFAFDDTSNLIPVAIASESEKVVDCASAKVRYIANIAATTPAGIYTTKINFIAAPQY